MLRLVHTASCPMAWVQERSWRDPKMLHVLQPVAAPAHLCWWCKTAPIAGQHHGRMGCKHMQSHTSTHVRVYHSRPCPVWRSCPNAWCATVHQSHTVRRDQREYHKEKSQTRQHALPCYMLRSCGSTDSSCSALHQHAKAIRPARAAPCAPTGFGGGCQRAGAGCGCPCGEAGCPGGEGGCPCVEGCGNRGEQEGASGNRGGRAGVSGSPCGAGCGCRGAGAGCGCDGGQGWVSGGCSGEASGRGGGQEPRHARGSPAPGAPPRRSCSRPSRGRRHHRHGRRREGRPLRARRMISG
mmetsp:Transcript_12074/g.29438  ORF Transcript_12074/g.29438 Transcript_12074/m.29438 type:complete len:296 (+) Transcript_12074:982-1869(+)